MKNICCHQDCLTIAETLITRAAGLHLLASKDFPVLSCDKAADFMECVWQLTAYTYPESISLPQDYQVCSIILKEPFISRKLVVKGNLIHISLN